MQALPLLDLFCERADRPRISVCPNLNIFGNTGVVMLSAMSLSHKNTRSTAVKKKKNPMKPN